MNIKIITSFILLSLSATHLFAGDITITAMGAKGDGVFDNTRIVQDAVDSCAVRGGTVYFPEGIYATGTVILRSNVTIYLKTNAVWLGIPDLNKYPDIISRVKTREDNEQKSLIYAEDAENITIMGEGLFSPNGGNSVFTNVPDSDRPFGIRIINCKNIVVKDISMLNSAFWMQRYLQCNSVRLQNLKIYNHCNLNNDGIDIDGCSNVVISDCIIDAADDAICLKSEGESVTRDVTISNCVLSSFATALKLGTGSIGGFKRIAISNCVVKPSESKLYFHEPPIYWGGLSGIDLIAVDGGALEDININNIVMDGVLSPIFIKLGNRNSKPYVGAKEPPKSGIRNVFISNISSVHTGRFSSAITGYPGADVQNVHLSNLFFDYLGGGTARDTSTKVPESSKNYPSNHMFNGIMPAYGFYLRHVKNIRFNNVQLTVNGQEQRPAFVLDDAKSIHFDNIRADLKSIKQPLFTIINSNNVTLKQIRKPINKAKLYELKGSTKAIEIIN